MASGGNSDLLKVGTTLDGDILRLEYGGVGGGSSNLFIVKTPQMAVSPGAGSSASEAAAMGSISSRQRKGIIIYRDGHHGGSKMAPDGRPDRKLNAAGAWYGCGLMTPANETPTSLAAETTTLIVCGNLAGQRGTQGFLLQWRRRMGRELVGPTSPRWRISGMCSLRLPAISWMC